MGTLDLVKSCCLLEFAGTFSPTEESTTSRKSSSDESFWSVVLSLKNMTESGLQAGGIGATMRDKVVLISR